MIEPDEFVIRSAEPERDWVEDFEDENGQYFCKCCECGKTFVGYKRRVVCRICSKNE